MANPDELPEKIGRWVNRGLDAVEAARLERVKRRDPVELARAQRQAALAERQRAEQAQVVAKQRFQDRLRRLKVRATTAGYAAGALAGVGVVDLVADVAASSSEVTAVPWFVAAAVSGFISIQARSTRNNLEEPLPLPLPPVPAPLLPAGTPGAAQAAELAQLEAQLQVMMPPLAALHADAANQLSATLAGVQPQMHALVERIEIVSQTTSGSSSQAVAVLQQRLNDGVIAYQELLAATSSLLASPDQSTAATRQLQAATLEMQAYAAGLAAAAQAFEQPY